ncbi:sensor histidine kinase [Marmoricola endophyticus]|uniref:sensor histidine kinase n=1 Tax=Marmoricola endophyticus TaxID=2040280 RepID=UPI00166D6263|nr:sensor histidine kinase [Marmoricola endophyticus]
MVGPLGEFLERGWTRPAPTAAQRRVDALVGVVGAVVCVASVELYRSAFGAPAGTDRWAAYVLFGVAGLLLAVRRTWPLTSLVLQSGLFIAIGLLYNELAATFTVQMIVFAVLYAAWAWSRSPRALYVVTAIVLVAMFGWLVQQLVVADLPPLPTPGAISRRTAMFVYSLAVNVVYFFGAIAWGQSAWRSTRRRAALAEQHERERRVDERQRRQAVRDERVRIARDLHDVVAHHISGIGLQATGAGRVIAADPDAARLALGTIESSSREAVAQMHQLVGLLRDEEELAPSDRAPQPGIAEIAALADDDARPHITHRVVGEPFPVPGTAAHSLYRVAQEAVTNSRRHSGAREATLVVRYLGSDSRDAGRQVELELVDDGRGANLREGRSTGGGYGLTGIRERVAMHGGVADIGPRPQGGFRVRVRIPVEESPR